MDKRTDMYTDLFTVLFLLVLVVIVLQVVTLAGVVDTPTIPHCQEDELVLGWGDYSQGYYEEYHCKPIDDMMQIEYRDID